MESSLTLAFRSFILWRVFAFFVTYRRLEEDLSHMPSKGRITSSEREVWSQGERLLPSAAKDDNKKELGKTYSKLITTIKES